MPQFPARLTSSLACAFVLAAGLPHAGASEEHGHAPAPAKAPAPAAAPAPATPAAAAPSPEQERLALEAVRKRLAERLGARPAAQKSGPYDMKVPVADTEPPRPAPAVPRRASAEVAAGGAGARRNAADGAHGAAAAPSGPVSWAYAGPGGPEHWADLHPDNALCARGQRQSPIDIRDGIAVQLEPIRFDYRPTGFNVIDTGYTVQVNVGSGNAIEVMGRRYDLVQFHFHRPSEERVNGRQAEMSAHLVHRDPEGRLAVVAVQLERGGAQPVVQQVWNNLPLEKGEALTASTPIDLNQLLPEDRRYYTYMGSITTPPCTEGVLWMVLKQPVPLAQDQLNVFSRLYPMNARPVQAASGRLIKESN